MLVRLAILFSLLLVGVRSMNVEDYDRILASSSLCKKHNCGHKGVCIINRHPVCKCENGEVVDRDCLSLATTSTLVSRSKSGSPIAALSSPLDKKAEKKSAASSSSSSSSEKASKKQQQSSKKQQKNSLSSVELQQSKAGSRRLDKSNKKHYQKITASSKPTVFNTFVKYVKPRKSNQLE